MKKLIRASADYRKCSRCRDLLHMEEFDGDNQICNRCIDLPDIEDAPELRMCQYCHKEFPKEDMTWTIDCQGINYRYVDDSCYDKLMAKGYDGQYYDERDENLDYDY